MEQTAARHRSLLVLCSVLALISGALIGYLAPHPWRQAIGIVTPDPTATPEPTPTASPLRIYVSGEVAAPAVYYLQPGSLVGDAVEVAGGPASGADMNAINLAQELRDQQQVYVPRIGEREAPAPVSGGAQSTLGGLLNINAATASELETLPNIGPATAQRIVDHRETYGQFETVEDLLSVTGIGSATLDEIRDRISID